MRVCICFATLTVMWFVDDLIKDFYIHYQSASDSFPTATPWTSINSELDSHCLIFFSVVINCNYRLKRNSLIQAIPLRNTILCGKMLSAAQNELVSLGFGVRICRNSLAPPEM